MDIKTKINIDLLEFFRTGKFDFLKLGQTKDWILNNFPDPDNLSNDSSVMESGIWFYGDIELHFNKNKLFLIFTEQIGSLSGGKSLSIDRTFLKKSNTLTLQTLFHDLTKEKIDFSFITRPDDDRIVELKLSKSQVHLLFADNDFEPTGNPNNFVLHSFSLIDN